MHDLRELHELKLKQKNIQDFTSPMAGRSLQASAEGIQIIRKAIKRDDWKQDELKEELGLKTRQPITRLLRGEPIERSTFEELCHLLGLNVEDIAVLESEIASKTSTVDELVQEVRDRCRDSILKTCSHIQLYTLNKIDLDRLFVPIFVCQEPSSQRESRQDNPLPEPALAIVERHQYLLILGKPGAGKSTFATYLAKNYCRKEAQSNGIPVLLRLKEAVDTRTSFKLLDVLEEALGTDQDDTKQILKDGKVILILDGLDEVSSQFRLDICQEINRFVISPYDNKVIITCRTDLKDYRLPSVFERVEIADFDRGQQNKFIENWFAIGDKDPKSWLAIKLQQRPECTSQTLIEQIQQNERIQELAKTPILLSLICLVYVSNGKLPEKRSSLYERSLEILLEDWDRDRCIENRVESATYKSLNSDDKRKILAELARYTFDLVEDTVAFEQAKALEIITKYRNCSRQESLEILEGIAADHGLVFRSACRKWEFSHLTFQEYFVAQWFVQHQNWETLAKKVCDPRWREVFLLTVEMANFADELLCLMKDHIDEFLNDDRLQEFLRWVDEKAQSVNSPYKPVVIRAFYFSTAKELISAFATALERDDLALIQNADLSLPAALDFKFEEYYFGHNIGQTFGSLFEYYQDLDLFLDLVINLTSGSELERELQKLKEQTPDLNDQPEVPLAWWMTYGESWIMRFRIVMSNSSWRFSDAQKEKLQQYYAAHKLFVECLNNVCCINREMRQEIEETMLLPIAEIEKRRKN